jgi:hypothetical protein
MASAGDEVKLVAEIAVAAVGQEMNQQRDNRAGPEEMTTNLSDAGRPGEA